MAEQEIEVRPGQTWDPKDGQGPPIEVDIVTDVYGRPELGEIVLPYRRYVGQLAPDCISVSTLRTRYRLREQTGG
jgi:hypothetical protein